MSTRSSWIACLLFLVVQLAACDDPGDPALPDGEPQSDFNCSSLPLDACEANGCTVFNAHVYDVASGCYEEEAVPAFCYADDIVCFWQGDPTVLTEPDGTAWYADWSCFSPPETWSQAFFPDGKPMCGAETDCLALSVDDCQAAGCTVFNAHPYDAVAGCYEEAEAPAFCQRNPDVVCGWQGEPIVMTEPDGTTWYADWSCFTTPEDWTTAYFADGKPMCGGAGD